MHKTRLTIIKSGMLSTVQDLGRIGYKSLGVSRSGALDSLSAQLANQLVNNPIHFPLIEVTLGGLEIEFNDDCEIALTGADCFAELAGNPIHPGWRYCVKAGNRLRFKMPKIGMRSYLAIAGNLVCDAIFNSFSTDLNAKFGGHAAGLPLKEGDELMVNDDARIDRSGKCKTTQCKGHNGIRLPSYTHQFRVIRDEDVKRLDALLNLDAWLETDRLLDKETSTDSKQASQRSYFNTFITSSWQLGRQSNRMGFRLENETTALTHDVSLFSHAVEPGTIQLPQNGQPIILMSDAQTTGGYPKLGKVIRADLPFLAQVRLGDSIQFIEVTRSEAIEAFKKQVRYLNQGKQIAESQL